MPRKGTSATLKPQSGDKSQHVINIEWVAMVMSDQKKVSLEALRAEAPSPAAFNLLTSCLRDKAQKRQFWQRYVAIAEKQVKKEADGAAWEDDQRTQFKLLDALERERPDLLERKRAYDQEQAQKREAGNAVVTAARARIQAGRGRKSRAPASEPAVPAEPKEYDPLDAYRQATPQQHGVHPGPERACVLSAADGGTGDEQPDELAV